MYGQVFFVLALAIALQSWRHSRLALARNLQWLAAFGLTHALYEWGDVFIPFQEQYMPRPLIDFLRSLQAILLAISFACLFQFGVEMLRPLPSRQRWMRALLESEPDITVVGEAGTAAEAIQVVSRLQPDIVLMDIRLPDQSGITACQQVRQRWPAVQVLMLTSFADEDLVLEAISAGAAGYVLKQVGNDDLLRAV